MDGFSYQGSKEYSNQLFSLQSKPPGFEFVIYDYIIVILDNFVNIFLLSLITFLL